MSTEKDKFLVLGATPERNQQLDTFRVATGGHSYRARASALRVNAVNMFVGANNAGKSRFLRSIVNGNRQLVMSPKRTAFWQSLCGFLGWHTEGNRLTDHNRELVAGEMNEIFAVATRCLLSMASVGEFDGHARQLRHLATQVEDELNPVPHNSSDPETIRVRQWLRSCKNTDENRLFEFSVSADEAIQPHCTYVPLLRFTGRFSVHVGSEADLLSTVAGANLHHSRDGNNSAIVSGLSLYRQILAMATGNRHDRDRLRQFEELLSSEFFGGEHVSIVPRAGVEPGLHSIELEVGSRPQRPLHHLGEGLGAMLLLLGVYFILPQSSWIGIEEPEMGLHPAFQRRWLDVILNSPIIRDQQMTTWITTHSPVLLGMASERQESVSERVELDMTVICQLEPWNPTAVPRTTRAT